MIPPNYDRALRVIAETAKLATASYAFTEVFKRDQEMLNRMRDLNAMGSVARWAQPSAAVQALQRTLDLSARTMEQALGPNRELFRSLAKQQELFRRITEIGALSDHARITASIQNQFTTMARAMSFAEQSFARLWPSDAVQAMVESQKRLLGDLDTLRIRAHLPEVLRAPSTETYLAIHQVEMFQPDTELASDEQDFVRTLRPQVDVVVEVLDQLDARLIVVYKGAISAISANTPDSVRHASVSLRELVTDILHRLAPDKLVRQWTDDPASFHNGRPTRATRLRYICRHIDREPFSDFVQKDVATWLAFIQLLEQGTHEISPPFDGRQLDAILTRAECFLMFLVQTAQGRYSPRNN